MHILKAFINYVSINFINSVFKLYVYFSLFKVVELQKLDCQYKELISQAVNYAEKLINNKISKQVYIDSESNISKKQSEIYQKMEALSSAL